MHHFIRLISVVLFFTYFLLVGCIDIDPLGDADNINYEAEFALPLFHSSISVADLAEEVSGNTSVRIESDGSVTVLYSGDLIRRTAIEIVPPVPGIGDFQLFDTVSTLPFVFNDFVINYAKLKGDMIHFKLKNSIPEDLTVRFWIPQLTKDGSYFEQTFEVPYEGSVPVEFTSEDWSLEGYDLISGDNNITYHYDARTASGEKIQLERAWFNVNFLIFEYVEGFFGKSTFDIQGDIITIGIFDKWVAGTLEFDDPKLAVRVDNAFGFPVRSVVNELNITTLSGQVLDIEAEVINTGLDFEYPTLDEVGTIYSTYYEFDKNNSNIREIFNEKAVKLSYDIDALANPENDPDIIGFTTDTSYFLINIAVEIPLKGKADDFTIIDTVLADLDIPEEIQKAEFKLISQNHFPVDMRIQFELLDAENNLLDVMFEEELLLETATLNPDGTTDALPEKTTFIAYDESRVEQIKNAKKLVLKARMTSFNNPDEDVLILDEFTVDTRMGLKVTLTE